jgi:hypothetical protein
MRLMFFPTWDIVRYESGLMSVSCVYSMLYDGSILFGLSLFGWPVSVATGVRHYEGPSTSQSDLQTHPRLFLTLLS